MKNRILLLICFALTLATIGSAASLPSSLTKDAPGKMKIIIEIDNEKEGEEVNKCDPECVQYCAKTYAKDADGFVQCMKSCGCSSISDAENFEYESEDKEKDAAVDFLNVLGVEKEHCCPVCLKICMKHCPSEKKKPMCKKHCKMFCCHSSDQF